MGKGLLLSKLRKPTVIWLEITAGYAYIYIYIVLISPTVSQARDPKPTFLLVVEPSYPLSFHNFCRPSPNHHLPITDPQTSAPDREPATPRTRTSTRIRISAQAQRPGFSVRRCYCVETDGVRERARTGGQKKKRKKGKRGGRGGGLAFREPCLLRNRIPIIVSR